MPMAVKQIKYNNKKFTINYELLNQTNKDTIVFLHGWASNKDIMKQAFYQYFPNLQHIYIDMPGFGKSLNEYILTTVDYGNIIKIFLEQFNIKHKTLIIVGHSFGGKVATLLQPSKLVLISSAGIIKNKSLKILLTIKIVKIFNKFGLNQVSKLLRSSDVNKMSENMYETFKNVVDEDFSETFKKCNIQTLILWGDIDRATTLNSAYIIQKLIKNSTLKIYSGDHYVFLKHTKDIIEEINLWNI
jgi:pimeloyl-ACP methyl ester carboxylesterase